MKAAGVGNPAFAHEPAEMVGAEAAFAGGFTQRQPRVLLGVESRVESIGRPFIREGGSRGVRAQRGGEGAPRSGEIGERSQDAPSPRPVQRDAGVPGFPRERAAPGAAVLLRLATAPGLEGLPTPFPGADEARGQRRDVGAGSCRDGARPGYGLREQAHADAFGRPPGPSRSGW